MLRLVRVALDTVGLTATLDALRGLYRASPRLMLSIVGLSCVAGVLLPAFSLASGALVEAVRSGGAVGVPLALVGLIFGSLRVLDPLRQELSNALTARVDRWIGDRIMGSLSAPRKIAELEHAAASARGVSSEGRSADGLPRRSIRFVDVTFTYPGRAEPVLEHFNLEIEVGRSLAIVGENGAGKTTLVKLLTRLYEPTSGRIMVDELGLAELAPASWHRRAAAVFQDFARFELAAYDNVAFGALHAASDSAGVERAAADAGAVATIERLPNGWQTLLSREYRGGAEQSGGECSGSRSRGRCSEWPRARACRFWTSRRRVWMRRRSMRCSSTLLRRRGSTRRRLERSRCS